VRFFDLTHLVALCVTLAVECACTGLAVWTMRRGRSFVWRTMGLALAVNLASHTLFWTSYPWLAARGGVGLLGVEALFTLAEALAYWRACPLPFSQASLVALVANLASFLAGGIVFALLL
jgi:hypothetical protein